MNDYIIHVFVIPDYVAGVLAIIYLTDVHCESAPNLAVNAFKRIFVALSFPCMHVLLIYTKN